MSNQNNNNTYVQQILKVQNYIFENLDADHSLDKLSHIANLSPYHFHRIFKGIVGQTIKSYIRRIRLDKSALKLIYTEAIIINIAMDAGFESHEAFTRAFKKQFNVTPSSYRKDKIHLSPLYKVQNTKGIINMEINIEQVPETFLAYVRHVGPYTECMAAWKTLYSDSEVTKTFGPNTVSVGIGYDNPQVTEASKIRYDACVSVPKNFKATAPIATQTLACGRYATVTHKGPYETLEDTYNYLFSQWIPQCSEELANAPCIEFYLNDPNETAPEELLTKVCLPLK